MTFKHIDTQEQKLENLKWVSNLIKKSKKKKNYREFTRYAKKKEKIAKWLIKHATDSNGNLDLEYLDFSDFSGDIYIGHMLVKENLIQSYNTVRKCLWQNYQKADKIIQNEQDAPNIIQDNINNK